MNGLDKMVQDNRKEMLPIDAKFIIYKKKLLRLDIKGCTDIRTKNERNICKVLVIIS